MTDDLVGRLRGIDADWQKRADGWMQTAADMGQPIDAQTEATLRNSICGQAADRIEALQAEKAEWLGIMRHLVEGRGRDLARAIIAKEDANVRP